MNCQGFSYVWDYALSRNCKLLGADGQVQNEESSGGSSVEKWMIEDCLDWGPVWISHGLFGTRKDVESMTCHELLMLLRQWTHEVFENSRQTKHPDPDWRLPEEMLHKARRYWIIWEKARGKGPQLWKVVRYVAVEVPPHKHPAFHGALLSRLALAGRLHLGEWGSLMRYALFLRWCGGWKLLKEELPLELLRAINDALRPTEATMTRQSYSLEALRHPMASSTLEKDVLRVLTRACLRKDGREVVLQHKVSEFFSLDILIR
eukprot:symbB.v1.2.021482.t2/scaffold1856.1/size98547/5